jgi:hypothetical protein
MRHLFISCASVLFACLSPIHASSASPPDSNKIKIEPIATKKPVLRTVQYVVTKDGKLHKIPGAKPSFGVGGERMSSLSSGCMPEMPTPDCSDSEPEVIWEFDWQEPPVTVTGQARDDGWVTLCRGAECLGFEVIEIQGLPSGDSAIAKEVKEAAEVIFGPPTATLKMCSSIAAQTPNPDLAKLVRNTTSASDADTRRDAARAAWGLSAERAQVSREAADGIGNAIRYALNGGVSVVITYSDGGTEEFKFRIYGGDGEMTPVAGSLKAGSGVSSCPAN